MNQQVNKVYNNQYPIKKVTVIYTFKHSRMGFNNSITVEAISDEHAIDNARREVSGAYGSKMLNRFTFYIK